MENYHLPFKTGMDWLRGACVVVKRAPATVFGILGCYVLALFVANLPSELLGLSWLGAILSSLVTPFGALAFAPAAESWPEDALRQSSPASVKAGTTWRHATSWFYWA